MNTEHLALLQQAPASTHADDTWARLCCEQALLAIEDGCYAVGALLVDEAGELLCSARNQVFASAYASAAHAEMQVLDQLEAEHAQVDRRGLTLYVSLEPCLMCYGRILLAGITRVRYLARDRDGGFALTQPEFQGVSGFNTGNPDLTAIYATGEPALLGAIAAVENQGRQKDIKVFGWDLTAKAISGIDGGYVTAVLQQDPEKMGAEALNALNSITSGKTVPKTILVPATVVTKANVDAYRPLFK